MEIFLGDTPPRRLADAVYTQLREAVATGSLRPGTVLIPSRELAVALGVSRHTITTAYGRLVAEGFLVGGRGAGTRVADAPPSSRRPPAARNVGAAPVLPGLPFDLRVGFPDPSLFPLADWRAAVGRSWRSEGVGVVDGARTRHGRDPDVCAAVAAWAHRSRSIHAAEDQVTVTAGAQHAFDLVITALVRPGDLVVVEDPGYPRFADLARARGATVVGVPVDGHGIVPDALPRSARLVHVTPSHQFPLGGAMSMPRRRGLLEWARRTGAYLIEDDYDSEFRFSARPLEPLQLLDADERVFYVATFSKTLSPALRLGYLVSPRALLGEVTATADLLARSPDPAAQRALATMMSNGRLARHINRARRIYAARHHALAAAVDRDLAPFADRVPSHAGLHLTVALRPSVETAGLVERVAAAGLALSDVVSGDGPATYLPLGYGSLSADDVGSAVPTLAAVLGGPRRAAIRPVNNAVSGVVRAGR